MINQDTTRAEKLQISIDETSEDIKQIHLVIQGLKDITPLDNIVKYDINNLVEKYENQINFLESVIKDDNKFLEKLQCEKHKP